ncbi:hypothetical protein EGK75_01120 [Neisseria weixii]|uniref:HK97 gp10 family phage protein n=1 Tax=Neisseria weixii TaxID=1853276 RepID=A0A3N4N2P4_9NEIS|nr:hypothetical protein [Neisseria weixii]RPD90514.1 hypothetical protein EGK74_01825 [Neisseria weixii]RPD90544.1 hypothetical protein EGK75_01120 [Neisseria weixii]
MAKVEIKNADKIMRLLQQLPRDVVADRRGGVVAKAIRKGSRPLLKEVQQRLQAAIDVHGDESTGLLMKNLKLRRHRAKFKGEHFTIGVGNKRYPTNGKTYTDKRGRIRPVTRKGATTKLNGARLEYGTSQQKSTPWLRPAFAAKAELTITAITDDLEKRLDKLAQKHLKG